MKKDWKYIAFISVIFGLYVIVQLTAKKNRSWYMSLDYTDVEPYGTYVLHDLLPDLFPEGVRVNTKTLYELQDSLNQKDNIFILANQFDPGKEDIGALLSFVNKGQNVFISAESYGQKFKDTLRFETEYKFWSSATFNESDSAEVVFANESLKMEQGIYFKTINLQNSVTDFSKDSTSVVAVNTLGENLLIRMNWGRGNLFINTTPAAFTNIYALRDNIRFIEMSLSMMPPTRLIWLENYQVGKRELATPLRFILTNEPLSWAYYLTVFSILIFMVFEAKRKQRPIPVIKPLTNTSLEFAGTIGNLYYQRGDHKNIIEKRILFFFDYVRTHFYLHGNEHDFAERLAMKSMKPVESIQQLLKGIHHCHQARAISSEELSIINKKLEDFYK